MRQEEEIGMQFDIHDKYLYLRVKTLKILVDIAMLCLIIIMGK